MGVLEEFKKTLTDVQELLRRDDPGSYDVLRGKLELAEKQSKSADRSRKNYSPPNQAEYARLARILVGFKGMAMERGVYRERDEAPEVKNVLYADPVPGTNKSVRRGLEELGYTVHRCSGEWSLMATIDKPHDVRGVTDLQHRSDLRGLRIMFD